MPVPPSSFLLSLVGFALVFAGATEPTGPPPDGIVVDDFEAYAVGGVPTRWQFLKGSALVPVSTEVMTDQEQFFIVAEAGNKFVRARVTDQAHRILLTNGYRFDWDLRALPRLRWDWRAVRLPGGAREDKRNLNDTGAAVYVFFDNDWLGRPRAIKYTYSSTLPVGTTVSFGALKVLVAASGADGTGAWLTMERDVAADYERLFGNRPPDRPQALALWSDSDNLDAVAIADFDNIMLLSARE